jgi:8-oxo-dGTP pyrophosphatase MutT (NUDIX family)
MEPQPAATVLLTRDGPDGLEVLLLERRPDSGFVPGAFVFPGGALDPGDADADLAARCDGPDDARASRELGLPSGGFAYRVAAAREAFEEAGILLANVDDAPCPPSVVAELQDERTRVDEGDLSLRALLDAHDLTLTTSALRPFAHWITPEGAPRRYDTRFFVAEAPVGQPASACQREVVSACWLTPTEALVRFEAGELPLILPTERCLRAIARLETAGALMAAIDADLTHDDGPRHVRDRGGRRLMLDPVGAAGSAA